MHDSDAHGSAVKLSLFFHISHANFVMALLLTDGLPPYAASLQRQKDNLVRFVAENQAEFDAMKYHPWTLPAEDSESRVSKLDIRPSTVSPDLRGVFMFEQRHCARYVQQRHWLRVFGCSILTACVSF